MVKPPSQQQATTNRHNITDEQSEALAKKLADKPYGDRDKQVEAAPEPVSRTTISLPASLLRQLEDLAYSNKREGRELRNVSAIVREALNQYLNK